jgi:hypothetical protein
MIFLLPRRLMRDFRAVIRVDMIDMLDRRHHGSVRGIVAFEFVGHHPSRLTPLAFQ